MQVRSLLSWSSPEHICRRRPPRTPRFQRQDSGFGEASAGDGAAAFLYALGGDPSDAAIAQRWLLGKYGKTAHWTVQAAERLNGDFFKGGQVGIPEIYYDTDLSGYLAFDWAYKGLEAAARKEI